MTSREYLFGSYNLRGTRAKSFRAIEKRNDLVASPLHLTADGTVVRRFDSLRMPFDAFLPTDVVRFCVGLGVGNVLSTFGDGGAYGYLDDQMGVSKTTISQLMWECGALGATFFALFLILVLVDSLSLATKTHWSSLGAGWAGVCAIAIVVLFYMSLFNQPITLTLFAFFSGLVVGKRVENTTATESLTRTAGHASR